MLEDTTISYSPGAKQQVEALELYLKYKGVLRNASKDLEDAQTRKAKAEADMAEARAEDVNNGKKLEPMEFVMPELMKESETDAGDDNKETGD